MEGLKASTATLQLLSLDGSRVSFLHLIVLVCLFEYYVVKVVLLQNPMSPKDGLILTKSTSPTKYKTKVQFPAKLERELQLLCFQV